MIEIEKISKIYPSGTIALQDINLNIDENQFVALVGENGAGKTTLVRIMATLLHPSTGKILIDNTDVIDSKHTIREMIGYQGQNMLPSFNYRLTGLESLEYYGRLNKMDLRDIRSQVLMFRSVFSIDFFDKLYIHLSGGQRQLLSLCRSLLKRPRILFLDEPTAYLDPIRKKLVMKFLKEYSKNNLVLITSHDLHTIENYADYLVLIKDGLILEHGRLEEVMAKYTDRIVMEINGSEEKFSKQFNQLSDGITWLQSNLSSLNTSRATRIVLRGANLDTIYEEQIGGKSDV